MSITIFVVGILAAVQTAMTNHQTEQQVLAYTSNDDQRANIPEETPLKHDATDTYRVAPHLPRIITIATIGVKARILQVGVDEQNAMQAPSGIFDAGWYTGSSLPGQGGAMIVDGHVSGPTQPGVFQNLKKLKANDTISIEKGDKTTITYTITRTETKPAGSVDMATLLVPDIVGKPGLNLITCGGSFDPKTNRFADRVIVYAVQNN